jgi:hypothetical protein
VTARRDSHHTSEVPTPRGQCGNTVRKQSGSTAVRQWGLTRRTTFCGKKPGRNASTVSRPRPTSRERSTSDSCGVRGVNVRCRGDTTKRYCTPKRERSAWHAHACGQGDKAGWLARRAGKAVLRTFPRRSAHAATSTDAWRHVTHSVKQKCAWHGPGRRLAWPAAETRASRWLWTGGQDPRAYQPMQPLAA